MTRNVKMSDFEQRRKEAEKRRIKATKLTRNDVKMQASHLGFTTKKQIDAELMIFVRTFGDKQ